MKKMTKAASAALCALASAGASADILVTANGLSSVGISWSVLNNGPTAVSSVSFDLSGTSSSAVGNPPIVFGGLGAPSGPPGGSATLFTGSPSGGGFLTFGFNFTGFDAGETFSFGWDPDIASDGSYGSTVIEGAGTTFSYSDGAGGGSGVMVIDRLNDRLVSGSVPVPVPGTLALLVAGLGLAGVAARRR